MKLSENKIIQQLARYRLGGYLVLMIRIAVLLAKNFREKKIPILAQSLAYTTIFTLVPILAIFFAVMGKITRNTEVQARINAFIAEYLLPQYVHGIFTTLEGLSSDSFVFGAIGFPTLFLTGVFLYVKVDSSINEIWMANKERQWFRNVLAFFMTLFLGPMILVLVFSIPPYLQNLPFIRTVIQQTGLDTLITQLIPLAILFIGLTVLYVYIPTIQVRIGAAIRGAFFAAVIIQVANYLLSIYVKSFARLDVFFGSLVTIPLLLLYVYVFWIMVLVGATLAFIDHFYRDSGYLNLRGMYNDESILSSALRVLIYLVQCFEKKDQAPSFGQLQLMLGLNRNRLSFILDTLKKEKLLTVFEERSGKRQQTLRYQPGLSPDQIRLPDLVPIFYHAQDHPVFQKPLNRILHSLDVHPLFFNESITLQELIRKPQEVLKHLIF